jgi:hypothetical protein
MSASPYVVPSFHIARKFVLELAALKPMPIKSPAAADGSAEHIVPAAVTDVIPANILVDAEFDTKLNLRE